MPSSRKDRPARRPARLWQDDGRERKRTGPEDFQPTKARGQNFLVDPNLARKLVDSLGIQPGDTVIEVGPGTGVLTKILLERGAPVVAIEKDERLAQYLREELAGQNLRLVEADVLEVDLKSLGLTPPIRLISNLPYSITSPAVLKILTAPIPLVKAVVTMQREVAERLVAPPGNRSYGRLSVVARMAGGFTNLFDLPPTVFRPRPNVWSRALAFVPGPVDMTNYLGSWLESVVRAAFSARRKQVARSLADGLKLAHSEVLQVLTDCGVPPLARAEGLTWETFREIASRLAPH